MDSFLIKYDIDDILLNKGDKSKSNKCICERLISLFSEVLTNNASATVSTSSEVVSNNTRILQNNSTAQNTATNHTTEIKNIYSELKDIRKGQIDLSNKFNIVMDKLNCGDDSTSGYDAGRDSRNSQNSNSQKENSDQVSQLKYRHIMAMKRTNNKHHKNLTGAKKRKCSVLIRNSQENQDPIEISHGNVNRFINQ